MKKLLNVLYVVIVATACGLASGWLCTRHSFSSLNEIVVLIVVFGLALAFLGQVCGLSPWGMWVSIPMVFFMALLLVLIPGSEYLMGTVIGSLYVFAVFTSFIPEHEEGVRFRF